MGLYKLGSESSFDKNKSVSQVTNITNISNIRNDSNDVNPRPDKWDLIDFLEVNNNLVIKLKYLNCTNYEGVKILVYKNTKLTELINQRLIDPHFSENKKFKSPIARFEPTEEGWKFAEFLAKNIFNKN